MPCYQCGARQADPEHGPSPWRRGLVGEHQVLVCPACQGRDGWSAELQSCARCGSVRLTRRLDQVECLDCRLVREAAPDDPGLGPGPGGDPELAAEVARALSRVLGPRP
jgi:hypothetical protein